MSTSQSPRFKMQREDGVYCIYLIAVDGREIPKDKQRIVYTSRSMSIAQSVSDALNNGLFTVISRVLVVTRMQDAQ